MLHTPLAQFATLFAVAAATVGWARGRWPERTAATWYAFDWLAGVLWQDPRQHHHLQSVSFALDGVETAVLLALVVVSSRTWLLWAAACALLLVMTHLGMWLDPAVGRWTYLTALYVWSFGLTAALGIGAAVEGPAPAPFLRPFRAAPPSTPNAMARSRSW